MLSCMIYRKILNASHSRSLFDLFGPNQEGVSHENFTTRPGGGGGGGGVGVRGGYLRFLSGGVPPGSSSPYPISDQKSNFPYPFSNPAFRQKYVIIT